MPDNLTESEERDKINLPVEGGADDSPKTDEPVLQTMRKEEPQALPHNEAFLRLEEAWRQLQLRF